MSKLFNTLVAGGIMVIPLLFCSFLVVGLAIERAIFWWQVKKLQKPLIKQVLQIYPQDPDQAQEILQPHLDIAIARIFLAALSIPQATPAEFALALDAATQVEMPSLKRYNNIFEIVVGLAPLLGLLGTVAGLIQSFGSLKIGDIGGSKALDVTGGISEALISTATGLIVAVMALIAANTFRSLYIGQVAYIDRCCTQLELQHLRSHRQLSSQIEPEKKIYA